MNYYDPREVGIDDLVKRIRVGHSTKDFLNTSVGHALKCFDSIIQEGENADKIAKYKASGELEP